MEGLISLLEQASLNSHRRIAFPTTRSTGLVDPLNTAVGKKKTQTTDTVDLIYVGHVGPEPLDWVVVTGIACFSHRSAAMMVHLIFSGEQQSHAGHSRGRGWRLPTASRYPSSFTPEEDQDMRSIYPYTVVLVTQSRAS